jgi:HAD superfamily hydrolase (TIGR01484 family)
VKPLAELSAEAARALHGVVFDLDDTLLEHGELTEAAYASLFALRASGLRLVACTGRPAGWGEVIARQWPIDAAVTENGAIAFAREGSDPGARVVVVGAPPGPVATQAFRREKRAQRAALLDLAEELVRRFPDAELADDNDLRATDVTIDVGEHRRVSPDDARAMRAIAAANGVRTLQSSVHLHLTLEAADKASGTVRVLWDRFSEDATRARTRYAFIGDSGNDAAAFAAFSLTFGVSNVRHHLGRLSVPPRFIADEPAGRGFASIAAALTALRARSPEAANAPNAPDAPDIPASRPTAGV